MKIKVFTGGITDVVVSPGRWMDAEVLGEAGNELICRLPGIPQCSVPKKNAFKLKKFANLKKFAVDDCGYDTVDDLMNIKDDTTVIVSETPIETGWTGDGYSCIGFITDNGYNIQYGSYSW